ncbi:hypothetical protein VKS41_007789 [Umbelopsis sp. WA50703]
MTITSSPVTLGFSAQVTFNIVDYMQLKREKNIASFPNVKEWERAVLVATRAAIKALLMVAAKVAGLERLGAEEGGGLSAYPAIGVFKPLDVDSPMRSYAGPGNNVAFKTVWDHRYKFKKLIQRSMQGSTELGTSGFVGIFGRAGLKHLKEVATDFECELLLLLAVWCEITKDEWKRDQFEVTVKDSSAMAYEVMGALCHPINYSREQFAVMLELRTDMVFSLLTAMVKNLPPWYRVHPLKDLGYPGSRNYPMPLNGHDEHSVFIEQHIAVINSPQGKIAWPTKYSLLSGMKCLGETASRAKIWHSDDIRSSHHVNVDPPKSYPSLPNRKKPHDTNYEEDTNNTHIIMEQLGRNTSSAAQPEQLAMPWPGTLLRDISDIRFSAQSRPRGEDWPTSLPFGFIAEAVSRTVIGVHLESEEVGDILLGFENHQYLHRYLRTLHSINPVHAFEDLWSALGYSPQLLEQEGGLIVLETCVLGCGVVAKWIAQTLVTEMQWVAGNNVTALFNRLSVRVDGPFWTPSMMRYKGSMDPDILGADLFIKYEACLTKKDIDMLCTDEVVCQMPSDFAYVDVTKAQYLLYRSFAHGRVCSLGSIVVVRSDDKYFALANWPDWPSTRGRVFLPEAPQCWGKLVGVGADLRDALLAPPEVVPVVAAHGDPLMQWVAYKVGSPSREVILMGPGRKFYDCAQPGRLLIASA